MSPPPLDFPTSPLFCYLPCSPHHPQQRKQELSRDNATLEATLQAARDTLARVSELLRGMDQAREVSTPLPKGCILSGGGGMPRSGLGEQGWVRRSHLTYPSPQEYEHLAASLDGARTPLLEKMHAFSPASSKLELVEAAEAHAWQLDQLALNLSRYGAQTGCRGWGRTGLGGLLDGAAVVPAGPGRSWGPGWQTGAGKVHWAVEGHDLGRESGASRQAGPAAVMGRPVNWAEPPF